MTDHKLTHLKELEAESIHIIREVAAEFERPVMLYSVGKDSAVMLHLTMKAFFPGKPPFPLMHVDTTWKFREMIEFRDQMVKKLGLELLVYINQDGVDQGIGPFTHGSKKHTDVMKTDGSSRRWINISLMPLLAVHAVTKKSHAPRNGFIRSAIKTIVGIPKTSVLSYGTSTTAK